MRRATITEAKNGLSALIDRVRAGETVLITDRGTPVARLEPMTSTAGADGRIERLERAGIIRRAATPPPLDLIRETPPRLPAESSVLEALLEERRTGR